MTGSLENFGGKRITEKEAYAGLGDPATWKSESDVLYEEFSQKPIDRVRQELKDEFDLGSI